MDNLTNSFSTFWLLVIFTIIIPFAGVYLKALDNRLNITFSIMPLTIGISNRSKEQLILKSRLLKSAKFVNRWHNSLTNVTISQKRKSGTSNFFSILLKSINSLVSLSKRLLLFRISLIFSLFFVEKSSSLASFSRGLIIRLSGVRNS